MKEKKHIFHQHNGNRWRYFSIFYKTLFVVVILFLSVFIYSIIKEPNPQLPKLTDRNNYIPLNNLKVDLRNKKVNEFVDFRTKIDKLNNEIRTVNFNGGENQSPIFSFKHNDYSYSAFYVNWDARSYYSLKRNADKLDKVFCGWLFLNEHKSGTFYQPDQRVIDLLRSKKIKIIPVINNFYSDEWQTERLGEILSLKPSRDSLIASIEKVVKENNFDGINVDFESIAPKDQDNFLAFQRELYNKLRRQNFEISVDLPVGNEDFDYEELAKVSDYIVLMVYDEHDAESLAGPVSSVKWFYTSIKDILRLVPAQKIIIGIGSYGYDWPEKMVGEDLTFQECVTTAEESDGVIKFDSLSSNLHYQYYDDNDYPHNVWFMDAVSIYNQIKTVRNSGLNGVSGFALWRLGSEDPSLWSFYYDDFFMQDLEATNVLNSIRSSDDIDFEGEGEILDVVSVPKDGERSLVPDNNSGLVTFEEYTHLPSSYVIKKFGQQETKESNKNQRKQIVLSFDDGPDDRYTPQILDILKVKNVKATFFVIGINAENNIDVLKRIYDDGHEIGSHTFFHPNIADVSKERTDLELNTTQRLLESVLGHSTIMFRPPYVADSEPQTADEIIPVERAKELGYLTIGESIDPLDWNNVSAEDIINKTLDEKELGSIILLHDGGGDRSETVKALPELIDTLRSLGYTFVSTGDLIGKTRDDLMPKVPDSELYYSKANKVLLESFYFIKNISVTLFYITIFLAAGRLLLILIYSIKDKLSYKSKKQLFEKPPGMDLNVSVIIPAFNEEKVIANCISSILLNSYPEFDIIVVDDGSTDRTYEIVMDIFGGNKKVKVYKTLNRGKSHALNFGINHAGGEIVITLDADTIFKRDTIQKLIRNFYDEDVAAVAGNVKVGNRINLLTKCQALEYITSQNLDRRAFNYTNCILVVPGAVGAYRKSVVTELGGFSDQTLTEDTDLTMRILRDGYTILNEPESAGLTEAPENIGSFIRQRYRWVYGTLQCFWKHKSAFLNPEQKGLGFISMPNIVIFQLLIPLIAPVMDLIFLLSIISGNFITFVSYYAAFLLLDLAFSYTAVRFEKEDVKLILYLPLQRFFYRQLIYYVTFKSVLVAVKGSLVGWRKFERTGTVKVEIESIPNS